MKQEEKYGIEFKGLKKGQHLFEFRMAEDFFSLFEAPQVEKGHLTADIKLEKSEQMLTFKFHITGRVETLCDRCLEPVEVPLERDAQLVVKFGEFYDEPTDEIVILPYEAHAINLAVYIYEFIVTALPIRHFHPDDELGNPGCNPDMLEQLSHYLVNDYTRDESDEPHDADPRWAQLKDLYKNNN